MSHDEEPKIIDAEFEEIIKDKVDEVTDRVANEVAGEVSEEVKPNRKQRRTQASIDRRVISLTRSRNKYYHVQRQRAERRIAVQKRHDASHARAVERKEALANIKK